MGKGNVNKYLLKENGTFFLFLTCGNRDSFRCNFRLQIGQCENIFIRCFECAKSSCLLY